MYETLTISFDGKEAVIKNPSDTLLGEAMGTISRDHLYINTAINCEEILVFPSRHSGTITEMYIHTHSISAVRFSFPTS